MSLDSGCNHLVSPRCHLHPSYLSSASFRAYQGGSCPVIHLEQTGFTFRTAIKPSPAWKKIQTCNALALQNLHAEISINLLILRPEGGLVGKTLPISHEPYVNVDRLQVTVISNSNRRKRRLVNHSLKCWMKGSQHAPDRLRGGLSDQL